MCDWLDQVVTRARSSFDAAESWRVQIAPTAVVGQRHRHRERRERTDGAAVRRSVAMANETWAPCSHGRLAGGSGRERDSLTTATATKWALSSRSKSSARSTRLAANEHLSAAAVVVIVASMTNRHRFSPDRPGSQLHPRHSVFGHDISAPIETKLTLRSSAPASS